MNINQWTDTSQVTDWFKNLEDKSNIKVIQLVIKEFYSSVTTETVNKAISFASNHTTVSVGYKRDIKHSRKMLLFHLEQAWKKKESSSCFDVMMGSYDRAELCKLIEIFTQLDLKDIIKKEAMVYIEMMGLWLSIKYLVKKRIKLERK